jgi:hypothetical protein
MLEGDGKSMGEGKGEGEKSDRKESDNQGPVTDGKKGKKVDGKWSKEEADADEDELCVSVSPTATDNWCQLTCTPHTMDPDIPVQNPCPESLCKCGDGKKALKKDATEANAAAASPAITAPVDDQKWEDAVTTNSSCVSIQAGTNDYWCQITCGTAGGCPDTMCKCGDETAMKKKAEDDLLLSKACDFEADGCIMIGGVMEDCRTCALHFTGCMASPHVDENNVPQTQNIDDCIDEVADQAKGCKECKSAESKAAWRLRVGDSQAP